MAGKKFYTVWVGRHPGVYDNWDDAREQVEGFPGARYRGFDSAEAATRAYREELSREETHDLGNLIAGAGNHRRPAMSKNGNKPAGAVQSDYFQFPEIDLKGWAVDASCLGNPGRMEYRCVELMSGREIFHMGPFEQGTNNIGEFLAIVHALALMYRDNDWHTLYSDSRIAMGWVKKRQPKTTLQMNDSNRKLFELLGRGVVWLRIHDWPVKILKWDTDKWGEVPADFDRK